MVTPAAPRRPWTREFAAGAALLGRGFGWWRRRPGLMLLGLVPAAIVSVALGAALLALALQLPALAETLTPFAAGWPDVWSVLLRVAVGAAVFGAALAITAVTFTALTLIVGEPFYDRIWRAVESEGAGAVPDAGPGFWRSVGDGVDLIVRGAGVGVLAFLIGLVPVVGGVAATVVGVILTGRLLADELASRALAARGLGRRARRALLRARGGRTLGFGVATQLCFLVPLGAVITMPAAVVGATLLARDAAASGAAST
ncbi:EI24 domain-containing protein [Microbacterium sp. GXF7504]